MNAESASSSDTVDAGCLPAWDKADLPEPLPFGVFNLFRTIGPGAILLAAAIGGGEWLAGPAATNQFGRGILWIATVAVLLQTIFNLEAVRYTLYTGEPIMTGFMRLKPGKWFWGTFYILIGLAQLATPALAAACGGVIYTAWLSRIPNRQVPDELAAQHWIATGVILFTVALLLSGKSIERVLERLSWGMIIFIFSFLIIVNVMFVPLNDSLSTVKGFLHLVPMDVSFEKTAANPDQQNESAKLLILLATFAATAGSGGLGNLAISNWFRDKGFGMGAHSGAIGNALTGDHSVVRPIGTTFPINSENMRRWKVWWRYTLLDQVALWAFGCIVGMFLNVNLAATLLPPKIPLTGLEPGVFQATEMAKFWSGFWILALLNGFWILFSTHLGNTDVLVRTISDISWVAFPGVRRWPVSRVYAALLLLLTCWAVFAVRMGTVLQLFEVLGVVACPIMAIASLQILRVNTRFLPKEIRPSWWRQIGLVACSLTYGGFTIALIAKNFFK